MADDESLIGYRAEDQLAATDSFPRALLMPEVADYWNLQDERGLGAIVGIPFGRTAEWALAADGTMWMGTSGVYAIARRTLSGDSILVIERSVEPIEVSSQERASAIEDLGDYATHPKMDLSRIPSMKPYFRRLIPDDEGRLWVLREGRRDDWFFDVFREDGAYLGAVELPAIPSLYPPPMVRAGSVLAVTTDSLDVQYVVLYEIDAG